MGTLVKVQAVLVVFVKSVKDYFVFTIFEHLLPKFKFKSVNKSVEVVRFFGKNSDLVVHWGHSKKVSELIRGGGSSNFNIGQYGWLGVIKITMLEIFDNSKNPKKKYPTSFMDGSIQEIVLKAKFAL